MFGASSELDSAMEFGYKPITTVGVCCLTGVYCVTAVGFGVLMMLLTFVAAELGSVLQV